MCLNAQIFTIERLSLCEHTAPLHVASSECSVGGDSYYHSIKRVAVSTAVEITVYPQALQEAGLKVEGIASDGAVALEMRPRVIDTRHSTTDTAMRKTQLQEFP